jgi:hypothetical protein
VLKLLPEQFFVLAVVVNATIIHSILLHLGRRKNGRAEVAVGVNGGALLLLLLLLQKLLLLCQALAGRHLVFYYV